MSLEECFECWRSNKTCEQCKYDKIGIVIMFFIKYMKNISGTQTTCSRSIFDLKYGTDSPIFIEDFIRRIQYYFKCSPATYIIAIHYLVTMTFMEYIVVTDSNIFKLLGTAIWVAHKFVDDQGECGPYHYAKILGISKNDVNKLEIEFLQLNNWKISVNKNQISALLQYVGINDE